MGSDSDESGMTRQDLLILMEATIVGRIGGMTIHLYLNFTQ